MANITKRIGKNGALSYRIRAYAGTAADGRQIVRSMTFTPPAGMSNVASQALQGVDNADNLLTFKMQLEERKTSEMEKRSERIFAQGQRSIYLIWVILFFFVACGWYSKIPTNTIF